MAEKLKRGEMINNFADLRQVEVAIDKGRKDLIAIEKMPDDLRKEWDWFVRVNKEKLCIIVGPSQELIKYCQKNGLKLFG